MISEAAVIAMAESLSAEAGGASISEAATFLLGTTEDDAHTLLHVGLETAKDRWLRAAAEGRSTGHILSVMLSGIELGVAAERCRQRGVGEECVFHPGTRAVTENGCGPICEVCEDRDREARLAIEQERAECEGALDLEEEDGEQGEAA